MFQETGTIFHTTMIVLDLRTYLLLPLLIHLLFFHRHSPPPNPKHHPNLPPRPYLQTHWPRTEAAAVQNGSRQVALLAERALHSQGLDPAFCACAPQASAAGELRGASERRVQGRGERGGVFGGATGQKSPLGRTSGRCFTKDDMLLEDD